MENMLYLFITNNRTFVAKCIENKYVNVVEFTPIMTNQGMQLVGILIGAVDSLREDITSFMIEKDSPYYKAYYQTTSQIETASGKRIIM